MSTTNGRRSIPSRIIGGNADSACDLVGASTLIGHPIMSAVGESLGQIREVMLDMVGDRIAYAVLELDGMAAAVNKLFAVPWSALTLDADNRCFILSVEKERLRHAPGFDKDQWPSMSPSEWTTELHRFYRAEPYWRYHS